MSDKVDRTWGYYRILHEDGNEVQLREMTINPGQRLSLQKHEKRNEFWFVTHGRAAVYTMDRSSDIELMGVFGRFQHLWVPRDEWHQLVNEGEEACRMIEIQFGEECDVNDVITR
jgi:mannose-6-phosphate isomerase-like protein (cupin superfamily)